MRLRREVTLAGIATAAIAVGSLAFAGTASANEVSDPVPVSTGATVLQTAIAGTTGTQSDDVETDESRKKRTWTGGAAYDEDSGKWRAYVTDGRQSAVFGSYDNKEDAQNQGEAQADAMNGKVVDGPGCEPPVLC